MTRIYAITAALLAGVLLAFLILLNSALGKRIGVLESSFMAHFTGSMLAFAIIFHKISKNSVGSALAAPIYLFAGGILGVLITVIGNIAAPAIGLLLHLAILTTFGLIFSAAADHLGLFGLPRFRLNFRRGVGLILAMLGVILIFWR